MRSSRKPSKYAVAVMMLVLAMAGYWIYENRPFGSTLPVIREAPSFTLPNLQGEPVSLADYRGKVVLLEFMFTSCPDICPVTTNRMAGVQERLIEEQLFGSRVQFLTVTFDPEVDTPEVLREYASIYGMQADGWTILRGSEEETKRITDSYGIMVQKLGAGSISHSVTSLMLIDGQQRIRSIFKMGDELDSDALTDGIHRLIEGQ